MKERHNIRVPLKVPVGPDTLVQLVNEYNSILNKYAKDGSNNGVNEGEFDNNEFKKLFYLQKITNFLVDNSANLSLVEWKNNLGPDGLEAHLQTYNVHRDASVLLMSIEFANAVQSVNPSSNPAPNSPKNLYEEMRERNAILKKDPSEEHLSAFVQHNLNMMQIYKADEQLQKRITQQSHFLGLIYAKIDAVRGFMKQNFEEYDSKTLGNTEGNNKNFILNIDGEKERVVIRVENRTTFGGEMMLQTHEVSKFFSEDYAMFLMPFTGGIIKPVVFSEMASKGDLCSYSKSLQGKSHSAVVGEAQHYFNQLNDFCLKLMEAGYYHPDIKLSNFLTDGERIIVSDRKTLTPKKNPKVEDIESSPNYGAPEYLQCLKEEDGETVADTKKAKATKLDMPTYMSFQLGIALKEFMINSMGIEPNDLRLPLIIQIDDPNDKLKNISFLIEQLTRHNPEDRLPIEHFKFLMQQIYRDPGSFTKLVEHSWPSAVSSRKSIEAIKELAENDYNQASNGSKFLNRVTGGLYKIPSAPVSKELIMKIESLPETHCKDFAFQTAQLSEEYINNYLQKIDKALLEMDSHQASGWNRFWNKLGFNTIPRNATVSDLAQEGTLPAMDTTTKAFLSILKKAGPLEFDTKIKNIDLLDQVLDLKNRLGSTNSIAKLLTPSGENEHVPENMPASAEPLPEAQPISNAEESIQEFDWGFIQDGIKYDTFFEELPLEQQDPEAIARRDKLKEKAPVVSAKPDFANVEFEAKPLEQQAEDILTTIAHGDKERSILKSSLFKPKPEEPKAEDDSSLDKTEEGYRP